MQLPRVRTWHAPHTRAFGPKSAAAYYAARQYLLMVRAIASGATKRNSWTSVREAFESGDGEWRRGALDEGASPMHGSAR